MKLNCILVDDSSVQRLAVSKLIGNNPSLHLVGEYNNAIEAKNALKSHEVDLIFLDIEMPVVNGFDLLESLDDNAPQIILITGKVEYALKAFDYNVTDYLHKPITKDRFDAAVKRANQIFELKNNKVSKDDEDYIFVKSNLKKRKVYLNTIKWIEALGDYIKIITDESNIIVLSTMKSFEDELPENRFFRIHKSYIINLEKVEKFTSKVVEIEGSQLPLSRNKKANLVEALQNI